MTCVGHFRGAVLSLLCCSALAISTQLPAAAQQSSAPNTGVSATGLVSPNAVEPQSGTDEISDLDAGTALPPSGDVARRKESQRQMGKQRSLITPDTWRHRLTPGLISGFATTDEVPAHLPVGLRPYDDLSLVPLGGDGYVDDQGVRMFQLTATGQVFNHPVGQAQYAIRNLNSFRLTKDKVYLDRAVANGQRLVNTRVESGGAWYFPYDFDFAVHGDTTMTLKAPWYSGMAQGQATSAFVRLYQATKDPAWMDAADAAVAALLSKPVAGQPFASWVDAEGRLWLEEYPRPQITNSERVLNGHIFALYGLYDYWMQTKDAAVLRLLDGAATTNTQTMANFRTPQWASVYSLMHRRPDKTYHPIHIEQALSLYQLTGRVSFIELANTLRSDYPIRTESGTVDLTQSARTAYRLDSARKVTATRKVAFTRTTSAPADRRERTRGGPIMLRISAGPYRDWWFPEAFGKTWLRGAKEPHAYAPRQLSVTFTPGTYSGYRLDSAGRVAGSKTLSFRSSSGAPSGSSAIVQGRPAYLFSVGAWKGYWVPMTAKILVR